MTVARGLAIVILLFGTYCGLDPLENSPIRGFPDFEMHKIDMPAWSEVPMDRDKDNLLQKSELMFANQVQGPESIAFDPLGRGPYTGVADGRILFCNGLFWTDFAYTSPDAYFGLMKVGPQGGLATSLATEAEGVRLRKSCSSIYYVVFYSSIHSLLMVTILLERCFIFLQCASDITSPFEKIQPKC